jgi:mxaC protein
MISLSHPWFLLFLPLAVLPWLRTNLAAHNYSWLALVPEDPLSDALALSLKLLGTLAITATVIGMTGPYQGQVPVEHVGRGAQIVVLLDRSRSMDEPFAGKLLSGALLTESAHTGYESKGRAARRLLAEFARNRDHDLLSMLAFTTVPIRIIGFTRKQEVIQAAIRAGDEGRGLSETDIGSGILTALSTFEHQPYNGSRVILMVSDGGAHLDLPTQQRITALMKQDRVALYWLYLRANRSPGLLVNADVAPEDQDLVPEHFLHQFFLGMGTPYHA